MANIKSKDTIPEMQIRSLLHTDGFRFRLHRKNLPGTPDIVLPKYKTAIQVRGCFWHKHDCRLFSMPKTNTAFWKIKLKKNKIRDKKNDKLISKKGWKLIVINECMIDSKKRLRQTYSKISNRLVANHR
jgi:DNA mismatch endonuclease (patch repair protein)|tara:strand:+ start:55 stop:441 length:387 start_codon:yes stop_codon:yes gene_type:complete